MKTLSFTTALLLAIVLGGTTAQADDEHKATHQTSKTTETKAPSRQDKPEETLSPMDILVNSVDVCDTN